MTPAQIELARHALGLKAGQKRSYRNCFVCGPGHSDFDAWQALVATGEAKRRDTRATFGGDYLFALTLDAAKSVLRAGEQLDPEDFPALELKAGS